jgi:UDP-N-acetylglucosamine transferase subunit ALG13
VGILILVTLGTQDKQFERLIKLVELEVINGNINEEVIIQAGSTNYYSKYVKIIDFIPMDKFSSTIMDCRLLITHGGVGSIMTGLKNDKKVIACPRLKKYGEHTNDHQLQIVNNLSNEGLILYLDENTKLSELLNNIDGFNPKQFASNNKKFNLNLEKTINLFINKK